MISFHTCCFLYFINAFSMHGHLITWFLICTEFLKRIKVSISHLKLIETEQDFKIRTKFLENVKEKNSEWCMIRYFTYIVST